MIEKAIVISENLIDEEGNLDFGSKEFEGVTGFSIPFADREKIRFVHNLSKCPQLQYANFTGCKNLEEFPDSSECSKLEYINLDECANLKKIGNLSPALEKFSAYGCKNLEEFPDSSECHQLLNVYLNDCINLKKIGNLSHFLEFFSAYGCKNLEEFPDSSECSQLQNIYLDGCINLKKIGNLSPALESFSAYGCKNLEEFPDSSECHQLKKLELGGCKNLKKIGNLSPVLQKFSASDCENLEEFPDSSECHQLKTLELYRCKNLKKIGKVSPSLEKFYTSNCENLEEFPDSSECHRLEILDLGGCKNLKKIGNLSPALKSFSAYGCENLEELPDFSKCSQLKWCNLTGCLKLQDTPKLRAALSALEDGYCSVSYPEHIAQKGAEDVHEKIAEIIKSFNEQKQPEEQKDFRQFKELITRFTSEEIERRKDSAISEGALKQIKRQLEPVLNILKNNPQQLEMADFLAKNYLQACVNQPVRGLSVIGSILRAVDSQKDSVTQKIQNAQYFKVLSQVEDWINVEKGDSLGEAVEVEDLLGEAVEVEAGNVLTREIVKKIIEDGLLQEDDFIAVPEGVAYEGIVVSWVTPERIDRFYEVIKTKLAEDKALFESQNFDKIVKEFIDIDQLYQRAWAMALFPEQTKKVISEIESNKKAACQAIYSEDADEKEEAIQKYSGLVTKHERQIQKDINPTIEGKIYVALGLESDFLKRASVKEILKRELLSALNQEAQKTEAQTAAPQEIAKKSPDVNPKSKKAEKKLTHPKKLSDKIIEAYSAYGVNYSNIPREEPAKPSVKKTTHPEKLRDKVKGAKFPDFSKQEPNDPRIPHANSILTRAHPSHNAPSGGKLRPAVTQHGDVPSEKFRLKGAQALQGNNRGGVSK